MKNKILAAVLSLVIAFGLWLYVITVVSPGSEKTYYDIPVIMQSENVLAERGLMITHIDDSTVTLDLAGNRSDLNNLNESNINIFASVSAIDAPGTHKVNYTVAFPGNMPSNAVSTKNGKQIFITGHSEYDQNTLKDEYLRDLSEGKPIEIPKNYFPGDNPNKAPIVSWRGHSNLIYSNWLNYFVYQTTPYDITEISEE